MFCHTRVYISFVAALRAGTGKGRLPLGENILNDTLLLCIPYICLISRVSLCPRHHEHKIMQRRQKARRNELVPLILSALLQLRPIFANKDCYLSRYKELYWTPKF